MFHVKQTLVLEGVSKWGKQVVKKYGRLWDIEVITNTVMFSKDTCLWFRISPTGSPNAGMRWIRAEGDEDFRIL